MQDDIELRHLRAFVAVAEHLNFSRAAEHLHLTQQSLSAQIQQLEKRLGVTLLNRTTRRVDLTEAGAVLREQATRTLADLTAGLDHVRRVAEGTGGLLSVSFTPTIATDTLPSLLEAVAEHAPELTLRVSEMWQADSVEAVRTGRLEAGLARHPDLPAEFDSICIRKEHLGAVVGGAHPLAVVDTLDAADLNGSSLVIWPREFSPAFFDKVISNYRSNGFRGSITEMSMLTRGSFLQDPEGRRMIRDGQAFSVAFEHQHDPMPDGFLWRPVTAGPLISVDLYWKSPGSAAIKQFVDVALALSQRREWLRTTPE